MKISKKYKLLLAIFVVSLLLRTLFLGSVPYGFHADEARAAWGAWSILKTGEDDWGNKFPMYYDTFGDQRPTGIFYFTSPFLLLLSKSVFAVRLPAALAGAVSVFFLYWLVVLLSRKKSLALLSALFLALSPWHIVTSRSGSEVVVSGALILVGLCFWVSGLKTRNTKKILLSVGFGLLSYFFYHTARVMVPVFWFVVWWQSDKRILKGAFLIASIALVSLLFFQQAESRGRLEQVSIFSDPGIGQSVHNASVEEGENRVFETRLFHNKFFWYGKSFMEHYLEYFSGNFLIGEDTFPIRYKVPYFGLMTYFDLLFFLAGVVVLFKNKKLQIIGVLLLLSPVIAAITVDETPNLHRALYMLYFICVLESAGILLIFQKLEKKRLLQLFLILGFGFHWFIFWHNYTVHTEKTAIVYHRDGGTMELALKINEIKDTYSKIYLTDTPTDITPWIGFFGNWDAKRFSNAAQDRKDKEWEIENSYFSRKRCPATSILNPVAGSLLVDAEGCPDPESTDAKYTLEFAISRPDGSTAYKAWKTAGN